MSHRPSSSDAVAALLARLDPGYAPTPLDERPALASRLGVAQVLVKDESRRALGSFKSLGGTYAALMGLAKAVGRDVDAVVAGRGGAGAPPLMCASDGNHGLAVALAARLAGGRATVFLHGGVPPAREGRIAELGASVVRVDGTYDDAVAAAAAAARREGGLLVPDTSDDPGDPTVRHVMAGYGVMATEIRRQAGAGGFRPATHLFVQAGVGGLAAAMAEGLGGWLAPPAALVVVEPLAARCVGAALEAGRVVRLPGDLVTSAEMLSCGRASAAALSGLLRHGARALSVEEADLLAAPRWLRDAGGPVSTPSGAAGLAGASRAVRDPRTAEALGLGPASRVLLLVTEGAPGGAAG